MRAGPEVTQQKGKLEPMTDIAVTDTPAEALAVAHSIRFRRVSNRYPRRVAEAYGGDLAAAAAATDIEVAEQVARWELANGLPVRSWNAVGEHERDDEAGR